MGPPGVMKIQSRERLSVLSPPIIPASQQERAEETGHHHRSTVTGEIQVTEMEFRQCPVHLILTTTSSLPTAYTQRKALHSGPPGLSKRQHCTELSMSEGQEEDEFLNLLYDPCLNCYFDPEVSSTASSLVTPKRLQSGDDDTAMLSLRDNNSPKPSPAAPQVKLAC
ncbi:hypothetical protein JZ751_023991 [Albula glossodonta]|uniref:Uncharacterized protein n=1 Tax=Albula glossodonta TaxID=121402 RepID=A0A8T2NJX6_9TELE|nr:hypothetical protein JZ751_023991 [Albula glossodonta]